MVLELLVEEVAGVLVMEVVEEVVDFVVMEIVGVPVVEVMELIAVEVPVVVGVLVAEVVSMDTVTALVRLLVVTTNARIVYAHHVLCQHLQVFLKAVQLLMVETHIREIHCTASSGES